jgi:hypothetical protein
VAQPKLSEHYGRTDNVPFNIIATCEWLHTSYITCHVKFPTSYFCCQFSTQTSAVISWMTNLSILRNSKRNQYLPSRSFIKPTMLLKLWVAKALIVFAQSNKLRLIHQGFWRTNFDFKWCWIWRPYHGTPGKKTQVGPFWSRVRSR